MISFRGDHGGAVVFCFMGCCVIVAPGARRTVSGRGCEWISGAVPLSSRKNAKGGEQGTQLACGSNKCPLPSNAFSRKPRGSHAPGIRHPGLETVLCWGMEGAREKERMVGVCGENSCGGSFLVVSLWEMC